MGFPVVENRVRNSWATSWDIFDGLIKFLKSYITPQVKRKSVINGSYLIPFVQERTYVNPDGIKGGSLPPRRVILDPMLKLGHVNNGLILNFGFDY